MTAEVDARAAANGSLFFVGNATTILRYRGFALLTDPNFLHQGQHAYLGKGLTSRRVTEPAISVEEFPDDLDAIVLSHLHGDHWDRVARRNLDRDLPILTTRPAARRLRRLHRFPRAVGLRTWQSREVAKQGGWLRITALPGRHAPGPAQRLLPPVMGSLLEFGPPGGDADLRIYISGDTLLFDGLREIERRCSPIDVAVLHLGGTKILGALMVTMDGRQGAEALQLLQPARAVPIHYDDYTVFKSPLSDFMREVDRRGLTDRVTYVARGETAALAPAAPSLQPRS